MSRSRATALALAAFVFATAAFAAGPPGAQSEQPAVSGDELQNLNRGEDPPAADRAPQAADSSSSDARREPRAANPPSPSAVRRATDRLELDTTVVTGNRELPKVLYIVPWKKADIGDLPGQPFNTLLDEVLEPVDREVFRREVAYYEAVTASPAADATPAPSADDGM